MEVIFYSKEGVAFQDALSVINTYVDGDTYFSASAEHLTCAKKEDDNGLSRYYVRKCVTGPKGGHFIDPYGALSNVRDFTAYDNQSARRVYEYTLVSESVFNQYVKYLSTRNPAYIRNAERDYYNYPLEKRAHASR